MSYVICILIVFLTTPVHAAYLQYKIATQEVVGISDSPINPVTNHGVIEHAGQLAANYPWPTPPSCTAGRREWTVIQTLSPLTLTVRSDLTFFQCDIVDSKKEVRTVLDRERNALITVEDRTEVFLRRAVNALRILVHECPDPGISTPCDNKRSTASTTLTNFLNKHQSMKTMEDEADALITTEGWE